MPSLDRPAIAAAALVYMAVVVAIGIWATRRTLSSRDFFIAGQKLGTLVTALAATSATFSAFVFLGGPGLTYRMGITSLFIMVPVGFTSSLICWTLAKRLRLLAEVREVFTIPDVVLLRFGSRAASGLAAVSIVLGSIGYLAAQLLALGVLFVSIFGVGGEGGASLGLGIGIGLVVILLYAVAGGMLAGVYTDVVQGAVMLFAAVAVFGYAFSAGGGLEAMTRTIATSDRFGPDFLDPIGSSAVTAAGFFFVFGIGAAGQPHMLHKFFMLRDPRSLRWMPAAIGWTQALCVLIWLGIGLAVPALVAEGRMAPLTAPDGAAPLFILGYTPPLLAGIVFAGVLAAIMSSADSFLNIAAAALVRDLPRAFGRSVSRELPAARAATLLVGVGAALLAYGYGDLIALLGTFAFGTFAAALTPALAVGLNWRGVTATAATASIGVGATLNVGLELFSRQPALSGSVLSTPGAASTIALASSFLVLLALSSWRSDDGDIVDPAVAAVMEM